VFSTNVRGLVKNWNSLTQINFGNIDIVLLNEIWKVHEFENLKLDGFKIATIKQRTERRGGGVIIFIKNNIEYKEIDSPFLEGVLETCSIKIQNTILMSLYRPPSGPKNECIDKILDWTDQQRNCNILIAGDWHLNIRSNERTYFDTLSLNTNLSAKITGITRIASGTCIDNFLTNMDGTFRVSNICIADHQGIEAEIGIPRIAKEKIKYTYREMKEENWLRFSIELQKLDYRGREVQEQWMNLLEDIKTAVAISFPQKERNIKYSFTMSQGLLKSKNKKNKLLKQYKRGLIPKETYLSYNKVYRKLIHKEKEKAFEDRIMAAGSNSKKKWKILKEEMKIEKSKESIDEIVINDREIKSGIEISKAFKSHFETCAEELASNIPNNENEFEILFPQQPDWTFSETTENEVLKIIKTLKPKASSGFDMLTNCMLKKEKTRFAQLITPLINKSLTQGEFPEALKIAKVIPIHKKGDKTKLTNYRPISLLPVLSKVFEKVINQQLTKKLDENNLIDKDQYGFRTGHGTDDAIIRFVDKLEKMQLENKHVVSVYIDVSKAFDSCNHDILIKKLKRIGLQHKGIELMKSYLKDRQQEVWVGNICGGTFKINIGVGQGTVLGPTLFKIYIMDMYLATNLFSMRFADDTSLIGVGKNRDDTETRINEELKKLYNWFCMNKLTLHPDKSRYIIHTKDKLINLKLGGRQIMRCGYNLQEEGVKLLGIIIDENMDWKLQINQVKRKLAREIICYGDTRNNLLQK